jgi:hypothetical protein
MAALATALASSSRYTGFASTGAPGTRSWMRSTVGSSLQAVTNTTDAPHTSRSQRAVSIPSRPPSRQTSTKAMSGWSRMASERALRSLEASGHTSKPRSDIASSRSSGDEDLVLHDKCATAARRYSVHFSLPLGSALIGLTRQARIGSRFQRPAALRRSTSARETWPSATSALTQPCDSRCPALFMQILSAWVSMP